MLENLATSGVPIVVGVSGHRDLIPEDIPGIRSTVCGCLKRIEEAAGAGPYILLSGLAAGADQIVAQEALSLGWNVVAVLPMPLQDYLEDFANADEQVGILNIVRRCIAVYEIPWADRLDPDIEAPRDQQYRNQGIFVVRQSQVVLVLWDGMQSEIGSCGTAMVASLCREGPPPDDGQILAAPEVVGMIHLPVRRQKDPSRMVSSVCANSDYQSVLQNMKGLNRDLAIAVSDSTEASRSVDWLMPVAKRDDIDAGSQWLLQKYGEVDALARSFQDKRKKVIQVASISSAAAAMFQSTYIVAHKQSWLIAYGLAVFLAYALYLLLFRLPLFRVESRYLEYRALAEAIRVQLFWRLSGITTNVAEHYLQLLKSNVGWVREAVRNIAFFALLREPKPPIRGDLVLDFWLRDQEAYFIGTDRAAIKGNVSKRRRSQRMAEITSAVAMAFGIVLVIIGAVSHFEPRLAPFKDVASAYSASCFLIGGVIKGFALSMAYEEEASAFEKAGGVFRNAVFYVEAHRGDTGQLRDCCMALGKYALAENADWLLLHRRNSLRLPHVGAAH